MATPGVEGPIGGYGADRFIRGDLVKQVGQHRAVALVARSKLYGTDVAGGRIHRQMNLAILASALRAMLARKPFIRWAYAFRAETVPRTVS